MTEEPNNDAPRRTHSYAKNETVTEEGTVSLKQTIQSNDDYHGQLELIQNDKQSALYPMQPFDEIIKGPAADPILQVMDELEFIQPSKIQSQAIPILNGEVKQDLIAQAQSGSGKTVAFMVSMLLHIDPEVKQPQAICLCHTRELTSQTFKVFNEMNKYTKFIGGQCVKNVEEPPKEAQLLFGTAASFTLFIKNKVIDVSKVNLLVIDEADTILEQDSSHRGNAVLLINKLLPKDCQFGFFSATFPPRVIQFIQKLRKDIIQIRLKRNEQHVKTVTHWYTMVDNQSEAFEVIYDLTTLRAQGQTYIFVGSKNLVSEVTDFLTEKGINCRAFSSDLDPNARDQTLSDFREEKFLVLITTDVLSRGIDVPNTYLVINLRIPRSLNKNLNKYFPSIDTYYHRAGRAGRFGRTGLCFNILMTEREERDLQFFCSKMQLGIPLHKISKEDLKTLPEETDIKEEEAQAQASE